MSFTCYGGNIPSNIHTAQDNYLITPFSYGDKEYKVLVLSDGCTDKFKVTTKNGARFLESLVDTQYGSRWMCDTFTEIVRKRIECGEHGKDLVCETLLDVVDAMPQYKAHDPNALCATSYGSNFSGELYATLFACIASEDECTLIAAGHGVVLYNGTEYQIGGNVGDGKDAYPVCLMLDLEDRSKRRKWLERWSAIFTIPSDAVSRLTICSDGVCSHLIARLLDDKRTPKLGNLLDGMHVIGEMHMRGGMTPVDPAARWVQGFDRAEYCTHSEDDATYVSLVNSTRASKTLDLTPEFERLTNVDVVVDLKKIRNNQKASAKRASEKEKTTGCAKTKKQPQTVESTPTAVTVTKPQSEPVQIPPQVQKISVSTDTTDDPMSIPDNQIGETKDERGSYHTRPDGSPLYCERYKTIRPFHKGIACVRLSKQKIFHINKKGEIVKERS